MAYLGLQGLVYSEYVIAANLWYVTSPFLFWLLVDILPCMFYAGGNNRQPPEWPDRVSREIQKSSLDLFHFLKSLSSTISILHH